jgi:hypothetical protein
MKLSEQYKRKLTELKTIEDGGTPQGLAPAGDVYDPTTWMKYAAIGAGVLSLIFGVPLLKKLFGKQLGTNNKITRYNVYQRIKDKKGLRKAGMTDDEIRDVWVKYKKQISAADKALIDETVSNVRSGKITAKDAMNTLKKLIPKGEKSEEFETFKQLEKLSKSKQTSTPKQKNTSAYGYSTSTATTSINKPKKIGAVSPAGQQYPNITPLQYAMASTNQLAALKNNPNLTYNQLTKY